LNQAYLNNVRIATCGAPGVGKTNLFRRINNEDFASDPPSWSIFCYSHQIFIDECSSCYVTFYDQMESDNQLNIGFTEESQVQDLKGVYVCYDVSRPETVAYAKQFFDKLSGWNYTGLKYVVACKGDLEKLCLNEGKELATQYGAQHWETSSKDNIGINELLKASLQDYANTDVQYSKRKTEKNWRENIKNINLEDNSVSVLIFGQDESYARDCAEQLFGSSLEGRDVWKLTTDGNDIFAYIRWPKCTPTEFPSSTVISLIYNFDLEGDNNHEKELSLEIFRAQSSSIETPYQFFISRYYFSNWYATYIDYWNLADQKSSIFKVLVDKNNNLRNVFDAIDANKNGTITADEIRAFMNNNDYDTNSEDAENYLKEISSGPVTFNAFRQWYMARDDYYYSPVIGAAQRQVRNLQDSLLFKKILSTAASALNEMSDKEKSEALEYKFEIVPTCTDYTPGLFVDFNLSTGKSAVDSINKLPDSISSQPIVWEFGIGTKSKEAASMLLMTLNMFKSGLSMIPGFDEFLRNCDVKFRTNDAKVFCTITLKERALKQSAMFFSYDLSSLNINGNFDISFGTALKPLDLLNDDFETLIKKIFTIKFVSKGSVLLLVLARFVTKLVNELIKDTNAPSQPSQIMRGIATFICFLRMIPKTGTTINWHQEEAVNFIKDLGFIYEELSYEKISQMVNEMALPQIRQMFEFAKINFGSLVQGFQEPITSLNFEDISFNIYSRPLSLNFELDLKIVGMDGVAEKFFA